VSEVLVYKNLRNGMWSVAQVVGNDGRGKLIEHRAALTLINARFVVKESRRKVIASGGHREVHAWIIGTIADDVTLNNAVGITYRPRERAQFFRRDNGATVTSAAVVQFNCDGTAVAQSED
jgi:hypothetical protein